MLFKINGVSINGSDGEHLWVNVTDSVAEYTYHVPAGMAGKDENGDKNYTVEAVYKNRIFELGVRNTTNFNVERSPVTITYTSTTVKNNVLSIKASMKDYKDNYLVGTNKICIKINGKTYQENGETKYFYVENGKVDLTGIKVASGTKVSSVTIVTGDRQAYLSARVTTNNIKVT